MTIKLLIKKVFCDTTRCIGCKSCEIACAVEHSKSKELFKAINEIPKPTKRKRVEQSASGPVAVSCRHCEEPLCIYACMSGAMYKDLATGQTKHDEDKCVGCWMCLMVCPFGALHRKALEAIVLKCDLCPDRDVPSCVEACPTKALFVGTVEEFERHLKEQKNKKLVSKKL